MTNCALCDTETTLLFPVVYGPVSRYDIVKTEYICKKCFDEVSVFHIDKPMSDKEIDELERELNK